MYSLPDSLTKLYIFDVYYDKQHNSQGYVQEPKQPTRAARMEWCCEESWIGVACFGFSAIHL
jgi:hypothetical protein